MKKTKLDALIQQLAGDERTDEVRAAREEAKWRAPAHPELRRALAEHYRRIGDHAQAGRWGIVFPGWSRPHEIARLRFFLLQHADGGNFVRRHLGLWKATPFRRRSSTWLRRRSSRGLLGVMGRCSSQAAGEASSPS